MFSGENHSIMTISHNSKMSEIAVNVPCCQLSLSCTVYLLCIKKEVVTPDGLIMHIWEHMHTLRLNQAINYSLLRSPLSWWAGFVASIMQRRLRQWKLGYVSSRDIDRTSVPRRWQGQQLIGPKWEWRGRLIAIDPLLPPVGSSISDYDHFTPTQVRLSCDGGISHREVLAPFAKAVIMRSKGQGQPAEGAITLDHTNRASSGFPLQFSQMDNGDSKDVGLICVFNAY